MKINSFKKLLKTTAKLLLPISIMLFIDSIKEVIPAYKTIADIIIAVRYSILPWPSGWFLSGFLFASLVPIIVIIDDIASDKLFIASRIIAIELDKNPIAILKMTSKIFANIAIRLVFTIALSLLFWMSFETIIFSLYKYFKNFYTHLLYHYIILLRKFTLKVQLLFAVFFVIIGRLS